jgi:predicted HD superfamily hydrolase involved in NAD metabolism
MHATLLPYVKDFVFTGDIRADMQIFLRMNGCPATAEHCLQVAEAARRTAMRFGVDPGQAEAAGWLHDISAVVPHEARLAAATALGLEVLPEEAAYPMILHQKLSAVIAREVFGVEDAAVLSAIGCHTTLKRSTSRLDLVVFVADKLAWDGVDVAPFQAVVVQGLERSLEEGALAYLEYLWERRDTLRVLHPWAREAYLELSGEINHEGTKTRRWTRR